MQTQFGHVQINVRAENLPFYADLMTFLGWNTIMSDATMSGFGNGHASLWFIGNANGHQNDYDGVGANHFGIHAESIADVDATVEWVKGKGLAPLFETPRHRPEFSGEDSTYYQVMFASPDNLLFEVVYTGPK